MRAVDVPSGAQVRFYEQLSRWRSSRGRCPQHHRQQLMHSLSSCLGCVPKPTTALRTTGARCRRSQQLSLTGTVATDVPTNIKDESACTFCMRLFVQHSTTQKVYCQAPESKKSAALLSVQSLLTSSRTFEVPAHADIVLGCQYHPSSIHGRASVCPQCQSRQQRSHWHSRR